MMVQEKTTDFKSLEKEIYGFVHMLGRELMRNALEKWDRELHRTRDQSVYRDKGLRPTVSKTLMGEVEYSRHVYIYRDEADRNCTIYLLDKAMGRSKYGFLSEALMERIAATICDSPYRATAEAISELSGQTLSHMAVWNAVQAMGKHIGQREEADAELARQEKGRGELESKVLFEEQDGVWISLQGKDRKENGKSKEMKVSIAYNGAEKTGKKRYTLTDKVACANFENAKAFHRRKEGVIAAKYNTDEIEHRILNGDGALWIKRSAEDENAYYQLSQFHRNQAVIKVVKDKEARKTIFKLLYGKQIGDALLCIDTLANSAEDEEESEALRGLYEYFSNNMDGLIPYHRRGLKLPEPPPGKVYRRCGAMESNIFTIIGNRMKGKRRNWSIAGGDNMARLLCLRTTGRLHEASKCFASVIGERYTKEVIAELSAAGIGPRVGTGYNGFTMADVPTLLPWLKDMAKLRPLSELRF